MDIKIPTEAETDRKIRSLMMRAANWLTNRSDTRALVAGMFLGMFLAGILFYALVVT